ncbi:MAG: 16S rRNA (adenine(1518)-N(6)/adenine(1519)-N(6))-dimethyltransferase RsmA [Myxococcota bacterium]|nr:16S rRNA (adenine(1518)-N(6)/adenine(1519)-N(6))-dimethyltransferase RsmA [Myxococcota bacterium]
MTTDGSPTRPAALLRQLQGTARKRFGQHFLTSAPTVQRIVRTSGVGEGSRVLEVGPGLGVLTEALLAVGAEVTAVELDRDLAAFLRERHTTLNLIEADAVKVDWPTVLPGAGWRCVANLPYNVGTRLVTTMVVLPDTFDRLVVMLQREVAERMVAPAGSRKRGSLSVHMEAFSEARIAIRVPPGAFHPPPKVDSAVIEVRLREVPLIGSASIKQFERVNRAAFSAPRKTLRNALRTAFSAPIVKNGLEEAGVDGSVRASTLTAAQVSRLAEVLPEA